MTVTQLNARFRGNRSPRTLFFCTSHEITRRFYLTQPFRTVAIAAIFLSITASRYMIGQATMLDCGTITSCRLFHADLREGYSMICPRCGNEWDVSKGPCSYCGLAIRMPGQSKSTIPSPFPLQKGTDASNGLPSSRQPSDGLPSMLPPNTSRQVPSTPTFQRGPTPGSGSMRPPASSASPNIPHPSTPPLTPQLSTSYPPISTTSNLSPRGDIQGTRPSKGEAQFG